VRTESVDVAVIGSGAGGAVVAHAAAKANKRTLILERGPYARGKRMSHRDFEMIPLLFKDGGLQTNTSMDMFIMQGSCVGGSTVLANNVLFRPPPDALDAWENLGASLDRAELERSFEYIEGTIGAKNAEHGHVSSGSRLLYQGASALGLEPRWLTTALGDCSGCGGCNIGCVYDKKPSTLTTFIPWAEELGARVLADTTVERIVHRRGQVSHLEATTGPDKEPLRIEAKQVVVAGGAIGSSGLLLKSKISKNVGRRLSFNVGAALIAEFPEKIDAFDGEQMSVYIAGDGYTIEPVSHTPAMTALMAPGWFGQHGALMRNYRHLVYGGSLVGSESNGRVVHSPFFGHEETRFRIAPNDLENLRRGLKEVARIWFAAGARKVYLPSLEFCALESASEIDRMDRVLVDARAFTKGSSHPQGGNALSDDPQIGVVDRNFAVHGFDNLFVADASVFTGCIRVNPIATVLALAHYAAPRILARG
jgi:choline dehydrogenase-like flavoprotein